MSQVISTHELEVARDLVSLLAVCSFTSSRIAEGDEEASNLAADLARCLRWAQSFAQQTRDDMVTAARGARMER